MESAKSCHKCGGRMAQGISLGRDSGGGQVVAQWYPGKPERNWAGMLKIDKKQLRDVIAYRCERCHLIDFYAE